MFVFREVTIKDTVRQKYRLEWNLLGARVIITSVIFH